MRYGSGTSGIVCGDMLCSEVNGKTGNLFVSGGTSIEKQILVNPQFDPLPSWNDGTTKQKIIGFVDKVTNPSSSGFVPIQDRIATFENDGTLWIEQPLYIPFAFHLEYLYEQIENEPKLSSQSPYFEILEKKDSISNKDLEEIPNLFEILIPAYPEISQDEYLQKSKDYLDNTKHPRYNVALKELTFLPMVELVSYFQKNDFKVYIVSAGFQGLMRSVSDEIYNINKENVIGTHPEFAYKFTLEGPIVIRQTEIGSFNDREEKAVNIQKFIGKISIFACGNSGGDIEMIMFTHYHENHFGCMVNHDDERAQTIRVSFQGPDITTSKTLSTFSKFSPIESHNLPLLIPEHDFKEDTVFFYLESLPSEDKDWLYELLSRYVNPGKVPEPFDIKVELHSDDSTLLQMWDYSNCQRYNYELYLDESLLIYKLHEKWQSGFKDRMIFSCDGLSLES